MAKKNNQNKKKPPSAHDLFSMLLVRVVDSFIYK
jgi:hypothetical protein